MLIFAAPGRVVNPAVLDITSPPRRFLGRGFGVVPKGALTDGAFWRLVVEYQLLRYLVVLWPFPVAMAIWPHLALPISQAPLLMFLLIYLVESRVLAVPKDARAALVDEDEAGRIKDRFRVRARRVLTRIAAGRGMQGGELYLVVEQSELARLPPLTIVSVQVAHPRAAVLDLTDAEAATLREVLFPEPGDEADLHRVNLAENDFFRSERLDASGVSAHARLEAMARG